MKLKEWSIAGTFLIFFGCGSLARAEEQKQVAVEQTAQANEPVADKETGIKKLLKQVSIEEARQTESQKAVRTIFDEGFTLLGEDDTLKIGVWLQNDFRTFFEDHPSNTQFLIRRARLDFRGGLEKKFGFRLMGEFEGDNGTNTANLKEGWLEYNQFSTFRIKIGQFKEPYGLENLYSDLWLDFMERPIGENFIRPEQDVGLIFFGKIFGKHLEYGVGVFNGSGTNIAEANDDKDVAGRLAYTPFLNSTARWMNRLTLGTSATYGKQESTLDTAGPTTAAGTRFLAFVNPGGTADVTIDDYRTRLGGDIEWFISPFSFKSEYAFNRMRNLSFGGVSRDWDLHGWSAQATYFLTGEEKNNSRSVNPKKQFNPKEWTWGALELASRFEIVRSDQELIDTGFATGSDDLWAATGGLNWYLNRHVRTQVNYVFTKFDDIVVNAGNRDHEHALLFRFQFSL